MPHSLHIEACYLIRIGIKSCYIHSEVETLDRVEILKDLRFGAIDVLVGVNLLREGLDLPEISLVAIMDADKEGFLRNTRSLTQTAGRAARHVNGKVIFYANKVTKSMQATMDETNRRRAKQMAYNEEHHITPKGVVKSEEVYLAGQIDEAVTKQGEIDRIKYKMVQQTESVAAEDDIRLLNLEQLKLKSKMLRKEMEKAVKDLDFDTATSLRYQVIRIEQRIKEY